MRSHRHGNRDQNWNSLHPAQFLSRCDMLIDVCVSGGDDDDDDATGSSGCYSYPVPIKHVQLVPVRSSRPDVCPLQIRELTIHDPEKLLYGATAWGAHKHTQITWKLICYTFVLPLNFTLVKVSAPKMLYFNCL